MRYSLSHALRYLILNPLEMYVCLQRSLLSQVRSAKVQITSDVGIEKNRRREKWRKEQEAKKEAEKNTPKPEGEEADGHDEPKEEPVDSEEVKVRTPQA